MEERLNIILQRKDIPDEVKSLVREIVRENQHFYDQQERFLEVTSHELRTPVTIIKGFIEFLIRNRDLSQEQISHCYERVSRNLERLEKLIEDVHDVTKINGDFFEIEPRMILFDEFVSKILEHVTLLYPTRKIVVSSQICSKCSSHICVDTNRLIQVVNNLISNAVKQSPQDSIIDISIVKEKNIFQINVEDTGIGMDDQLQKKLNKPFMHFPTDYSVTGVGLGVYIVKGIVEAHGGTVIFSSQEDTGTIVMVTIPIPNDHELPSKSKSFTDLRIMFDKMLTDSKRVNKKSASK